MSKVASKYMLGLSATMKRKDGLSKVFYWYLGGIVYHIKKRVKEDVDVKIIKYSLANGNKVVDSYNKEVYNFQGKISIPNMITNICSYKPRTEYIIKQIVPLVKQGRKILILSDRRAQLTDLKTILDSSKVSSFNVTNYIAAQKYIADNSGLAYIFLNKVLTCKYTVSFLTKLLTSYNPSTDLYNQTIKSS